MFDSRRREVVTVNPEKGFGAEHRVDPFFRCQGFEHDENPAQHKQRLKFSAFPHTTLSNR